ncbi:GNAT family N-acetyltransferase [Enterovibrio makurazakiensis]|uniref:GNAT family N-acetyltransferase n=1 Tax=Enterovibrio gelatinilyticus TaxID=2899819 RepID=A0ABT5R165_9GAMM|nr:GNAT family N-acetyltransferase [Enterovibrio sp. ZSDZ42]MDD1794014.1 GNAT family N-acetyltransferase [Enterovibrio sp. ZSDZ42]
MEIRIDDLSGKEIQALLQQHLTRMHEISPAESVHALDLSGLQSSDVTLWSAWIDGQLAGCGALKKLSPTHGEIKSMRTSENFLRRGVAANLLAHILQESRRRQYSRLSLETGTEIEFDAARKLYERFGFEICSPFADYVEDPNSAFYTRALQQFSPAL